MTLRYKPAFKRRGRVLDYRWKGPRFVPWPGHGDFLEVRDIEFVSDSFPSAE